MRLDQLLVARRHAQSRSKAQDLIKRGLVRVNGRLALKTGLEVASGCALEVLENKHYVGRGALKLLAALEAFGFSPAGRNCLDIGASTGGFTEVLLEGGAACVVAVDVGRNQLHPSLRSDPRVISMEETDARLLKPKDVSAQAVTCDVSFISLLKILPSVLGLAEKGAWLVALVKPQFEVGHAFVGKGGIVKDKAAVADAVERVRDCIQLSGWSIAGTLESPIAGQNGNEEILIGATL